MRGAEFDVARLAARAGDGGTTLTELADTLVRDHGMPFRTAHAHRGAAAEGAAPRIRRRRCRRARRGVAPTVLGRAARYTEERTAADPEPAPLRRGAHDARRAGAGGNGARASPSRAALLARRSRRLAGAPRSTLADAERRLRRRGCRRCERRAPALRPRRSSCGSSRWPRSTPSSSTSPADALRSTGRSSASTSSGSSGTGCA